MFYKQKITNYKQPLEGVEFKTLVYGENTLLTEFRLKKDSQLPIHKHVYEQTGYLISGRLQLKIGEETILTEPGDAWCIPANMEHGAAILEDSVALEVFSPAREDYLP
ncbi:MAG: cupin domain-containing protein [Candidatus Omnitrophota bacterium]|jgi:quercetin dioxygenase-like cupin family protein|nr:MAG: cupin domain-containing protein [Candidatus Omnitrophota bacterium]